MAVTKYLTKEGTQMVIDDYNNKLSLKADKTDLSAYATKADLENLDIDIPDIDLSNYATKSDVSSVAATVANLHNYDDTELTNRVNSLEGQLTGVYHYKGTKADLATLIATVQNPAEGDAYNLLDTGMNVAWDGEQWDEFGSTIDTSNFITNDDVQALTRAEVNAILFSGRTAVVTNTESILAVLDNNQTDVEITVTDNIALTEKATIPEGKKVTLDLGGKTISSTGIAFNVDGGELVVKNGTIAATNKGITAYNGGEVTIDGATITSSGNSAIGLYEGAELTVNSGNVTAQEYGIGTFHGSSVVINGGTITGNDNSAIGGNGSIYYDTVQGKPVPNPNENTITQDPVNVTINGGTIIGHIQSDGYIAAGIYWPNAGTLTINGGKIVSDGAGIVQRGGTVIIGAGADIEVTGATGVTGKVGDARQVVGPYAVVYDYNSQYPAYQSMALNIANGAKLVGTDGDLQVLPADAPGIVDNRS